MSELTMSLEFGASGLGGRRIALTPGVTAALRLQDAAEVLGFSLASARPCAAPEQLAMVRDALEPLLDPWSQTARLFLCRYFDWVQRTVETHKRAVGERLAMHGNVLWTGDVIYSALFPLPRPRFGKRGSAQFAFWTGRQILGVYIGEPDIAPHLEPVVPVFIPRAALADGSAFAAALPIELSDFWSAPVLPRGPLGTRLPLSPDQPFTQA